MTAWGWPLGVLTVLVLFFRIKNNRRSRNLPPGPPGWPVIGNILDIDAAAHSTLATLSEKHGPVIWLRLGAVNTMVVSSAEAAMDMFKNHDISFAGRTTNEATRSFDYEQGSMALGQYGPYWRMLRRICTTEMFTNSRLNGTERLRMKCVDNMLRWMWDEAQVKGTVGIARFVSIMSFNVTSNVTLSKDLVDPQSEDSAKFFTSVSRGIELGGEPNIADFFPFMRWIDPQGIRKKMEDHMGPVHTQFQGFVKERILERQSGRGNTKKDFLDVMLDFQGSHKDGEPAKMSEENIGIMLLELFAASTDTTTSTIEWAMAELLRNPNKMKLVQAELDQVVGVKRKVLESDIPCLHYLQAVVKETLRLHPAVPLLIPRKAMKDTEFRGYLVPKGTQILVNVWAIGRDRSFWDNPMLFKPERFLSSNIDYKGSHFHFLPFGAGRRICVGMPLANRTLHLALGSILHSFEWELPPGITPENMDMTERLGIALGKAEKLEAVMSVRAP